MPNTSPLFQVDAFTQQAFAGNPAAVCLLEQAADPAWMQAVAAEMNLSETAFVHRVENGFNLRWFTPHVEVDLCGHATLASAHILWQQGWLAKTDTAHFHTKSGLLTAQHHAGLICLDFPATPAQAVTPPAQLLAGLSIEQAKVYFNQVDYLVVIETEQQLRQLQPDFACLQTLPVRGIIVSASAQDYDFVSRFFAPAVGINEDPVTGSAHCTLAPYWAQQLGKTQLQAYQASARGGELQLQLQGERVLLSGHAVTVFHAELYC